MQTKRRSDALDSVGAKGISDSALAHVMRLVSERQLAPLSARQVGALTAREFAKIQITLQFPLASGGHFEWEIAAFGKLLNFFIDESAAFRGLTERAVAQRHNMNMLLYIDEITPGNVLRPDNRRKVWAIYASFYEFGKDELCKEYVWLPVARLRSDVAKRVAGGMSSCMRVLCNSLWGEGQQALATEGVLLNLSRPKICTAKLRSVIADAPAIKYFFNFKGSSGVKPCPSCLNVVKRGFAGYSEDSVIVDITCCDMNRITPTTDQDIWDAFDSMAGATTKAQLERLERATGLLSSEHGILADAQLRRHVLPSTCLRWDWVHILMVGGGVLSHELFRFLRGCKEEFGFGFATFNDYVSASWRFAAAAADRQKIKYISTEAREIQQCR